MEALMLESFDIYHSQKMTAALLDMPCYNCDIIETGNDSYRMKKRK